MTLRIFLLSMARGLGFFILFIPVASISESVSMLRMFIVTSLSLPIFYYNLGRLEEIKQAGDLALFSSILGELLLGALIGFLASVPFIVVRMAGAVIDAMRGGSNPTITDDDSDPLSPTAEFLFISGVLVFVVQGGFEDVLKVLYLPGVPVLTMDVLFGDFQGKIEVILMILHMVFVAILKVSLPVCVIYLFADLIVGFFQHMNKKSSMGSEGFIIKNLLFVTLLPIYIYYVSDMQSRDITIHSSEIRKGLETFLE